MLLGTLLALIQLIDQTLCWVGRLNSKQLPHATMSHMT